MNNNINIRKYNKKDKYEVLDLVHLNTPQYFASEEATDFDYYLENEIELYYVLESENKIVGCGGINFEENKTIAKISWDVFHPDYQGKSLGTQLLKHRIKELESVESIQKVTVRTSQMAYRFYEKQGFTLLEMRKDYWAKGFDMYNMEYDRLKEKGK